MQIHRLVLALGAAAALAPVAAAVAPAASTTPAAPAAGPGSILYLKNGKLWTTRPDGKLRRRIPHAGRFINPSQADNGTIVAQRGVYLYRLNRRGKLLNKPITTAFRTNRILPAFNGPFWPQVSPDGKRIAYTYSYTTSYYDYACNCQVSRPAFHTAYTDAGRFTNAPERVFGNPWFYSKPSWIDNRRVLLTTEALFDYAGNVLDTVVVDTIGGAGDKTYQRWFSECVSGCDDLLTLQMYTLDDGEVTRQQDKAVFIAGELGSKETGSRMLIYRLGGRPPALPTSFCHVTGANGKFSSPTWSPDGRSLAWQDAKGVWVGRVDSIDGDSCSLTRRLVVPGGTAPDWGPARP